jgi:hypothetical protein
VLSIPRGVYQVSLNQNWVMNRSETHSKAMKSNEQQGKARQRNALSIPRGVYQVSLNQNLTLETE